MSLEGSTEAQEMTLFEESELLFVQDNEKKWMNNVALRQVSTEPRTTRKKMKRQHLSVQPIDNRPVPFKVTILSKEI